MKYLVTWGDGYLAQGSKVVSVDFFNEMNGYEPETIGMIRALKVNQSLNLSDLSGTQIVLAFVELSGDPMNNR